MRAVVVLRRCAKASSFARSTQGVAGGGAEFQKRRPVGRKVASGSIGNQAGWRARHLPGRMAQQRPDFSAGDERFEAAQANAGGAQPRGEPGRMGMGIIQQRAHCVKAGLKLRDGVGNRGCGAGAARRRLIRALWPFAGFKRGNRRAVSGKACSQFRKAYAKAGR